MIEIPNKYGLRCKTTDEIEAATLLVVDYKGHYMNGCIIMANEQGYDPRGSTIRSTRLTYCSGHLTEAAKQRYWARPGYFDCFVKKSICRYYGGDIPE